MPAAICPACKREWDTRADADTCCHDFHVTADPALEHWDDPRDGEYFADLHDKYKYERFDE